MANTDAIAPKGAPFAISGRHLEPQRACRWRTPLAFLVIGGVIGAALLGLLGGGPSRVSRIENDALTAQIVFDPIVRSGNWFETALTITARQPVKDLTVSIDQDLWRKMSIDTIAPDAESAESKDGTYRYHFGEVKPGATFRIKFDGQIQAGLMRQERGRIVLQDDTRPLLNIPLTLTVLP